MVGFMGAVGSFNLCIIVIQTFPGPRLCEGKGPLENGRATANGGRGAAASGHWLVKSEKAGRCRQRALPEMTGTL